jgi:hypothetical protein
MIGRRGFFATIAAAVAAAVAPRRRETIDEYNRRHGIEFPAKPLLEGGYDQVMAREAQDEINRRHSRRLSWMPESTKPGVKHRLVDYYEGVPIYEVDDLS